MTDPDLDAIAKRANLATPGPWTIGIEMDGVYADMPTVVRLDHGPRIVTVGQTRPHASKGGAAEANVAFIAAARTDVPALIARIRELEQRLAEVFNIGMDLGDSDEPPAWRAGTRLRQIAQDALGRDIVHRLAAERPVGADEDDLPQDAR